MKQSIRPLSILLLSTAIGLAGCQTLDPYTQESKTSNATKGALIGAAAGAVVGGAGFGSGISSVVMTPTPMSAAMAK